MKNIKNKELENINFVKTILMILIVLYHSMVFFTGNWFNQRPIFESHIIAMISKYLNGFHIYAFTLISGYLFYYLHTEKSRYNDFTEIVFSKIKRLIIPYISVSIFWVIPSYIFYYETNLFEIVKKYLFGIAPSQLWFLLMLFGVYMISYIAWKPLTTNIIIGGGTVVTLSIVGICGGMILPNIFQIFTSCRYVLFFWIGMMLRKYGTKKLDRINPILYIGGYTVLFIFREMFINYIAIGNIIVTKIFSIGTGIVLNIVGAVSAFVVFNKLSNINKLSNNKIIKELGKYSFIIYLFHQQLIYGVIDLFNGIVHPVILVILSFIISITISYFIACVLNTNQISRKLIGMK